MIELKWIVGSWQRCCTEIPLLIFYFNNFRGHITADRSQKWLIVPFFLVRWATVSRFILKILTRMTTGEDLDQIQTLKSTNIILHM